MANCLITFTRWSALRWITLGTSATAAFIGLSVSSQLIANFTGFENPFASLPFAIIYSLILGVYFATQVQDSNFIGESHKHKWIGLSVFLAVSHPVSALLGLFVLMGTVRSRISNESACTIPANRTHKE